MLLLKCEFSCDYGLSFLSCVANDFTHQYEFTLLVEELIFSICFTVYMKK